MANPSEDTNTAGLFPQTPSTTVLISNHDIVTEDKNTFILEINDMARQLLQHLILIVLLLFQLQTLPLLFILRKMQSPDVARCSPFTVWTSSPPSLPDWLGRILDRMTYRRLLQKLHSMIQICTTPLRLARNLYHISKVVDRYPDACMAQIGQHTAYEFPTRSSSYLSITSSHLRKTLWLESVAASASQIYHAALVDSETLDEMLAAISSPSADTSSSQPGMKQSSRGNMIDIGMEEIRSSDVQTTMMDVEVNRSPAEVQNGDTVEHAAQCAELSTTQSANEIVNTGHADVATQHSSVLSEDIVERERYIKATCNGYPQKVGGVADRDIVQLDQCPTFVQRHSRSKLPVRTLIGQDEIVDSAVTDKKASILALRDSRSGTHKKLQRRKRKQ